MLQATASFMAARAWSSSGAGSLNALAAAAIHGLVVVCDAANLDEALLSALVAMSHRLKAKDISSDPSDLRCQGVGHHYLGPRSPRSSGVRAAHDHLGSERDTIIWGQQSASDTIIWGQAVNDTIIWGKRRTTRSSGARRGQDTIIWGQSSQDTIIWGQAATTPSSGVRLRNDTIIWGQRQTDTIVWGQSRRHDHLGASTGTHRLGTVTPSQQASSIKKGAT